MAAASSTAALSLEYICSIEDIFHRHLLPCLTYQDVGRLEMVSKAFYESISSSSSNHDECWHILCHRDFRGIDGETTTPMAPVYNRERDSFDQLVATANWKQAYEKWSYWNAWTHGGATAQHMVEAVQLWNRFKDVVLPLEMHNTLHSLCPCLGRDVFGELAGKIPSSLVAFYSVHGGQRGLRARSQDHEFFSGLFGSYSCYNNFYSMRLLNVADFGSNAIVQTPSHEGDKMILIGISPGSPRMFLYLCLQENDNEDEKEGSIVMVHNNPLHAQSIRAQHATVGRGGILTYFRNYIERLETGIFKPCQVIPESITSRGINLFPDAGDAMSVCVTRGIEVRASARWFPGGIMDQQGEGLNFGYSIRIQKLVAPDNENDDDTRRNDIPETCQLVGRHWVFMNGNGDVNRVDGEAVIGKQPLFFVENGKSGFIDLGTAGDGNRYRDKVFVYQSQSGPVAGTTQEDTKRASARGTFSFVPGSIENPQGPVFHVRVETFPFKIPFPFY